MRLISDTEIQSFGDFVASHESFIVAGHKEPDGDCMASCIGVAAILAQNRKKYTFFSAGPFKRVEIKKYEQLFQNRLPEYFESSRETIGLIVVDCSEHERLGETNIDFAQFDTFTIDHHRSPLAEDKNAKNVIIDYLCPATALLVQQIYEKLCGKIPEDVADALFFGLVTDTNFFRFLNPFDGEVLRLASRLVDSGANPRRIYDTISGGKPFAACKLLGLILNRAEKKFGGRLIYVYETLEDSKKFAKEGRDTDNLYAILLAVTGVEAVLFVRQENEEKCTAGFRSRGDLNVSEIAAKFGGGGHKNAAGLSCTGKIAEVSSAILNEFAQVLGDISAA
ncbi:MAG: bifunctional oligoribonuclease/PAP phosphatase NrnA [Treponemataceae bacterium]|nr:MAG: bifunctional oligoribonuclease/PAP phosphatase NrnA [Treponemataceae bacterium]